VLINIVNPGKDELRVDTKNLMFTASDWDRPQNVSCTGLNDNVHEGIEKVPLLHSIREESSVKDYHGAPFVAGNFVDVYVHDPRPLPAFVHRVSSPAPSPARAPSPRPTPPPAPAPEPVPSEAPTLIQRCRNAPKICGSPLVRRPSFDTIVCDIDSGCTKDRCCEKERDCTDAKGDTEPCAPSPGPSGLK